MSNVVGCCVPLVLRVQQGSDTSAGKIMFWTLLNLSNTEDRTVLTRVIVLEQAPWFP
jgi:hypothetical protein